MRLRLETVKKIRAMGAKRKAKKDAAGLGHADAEKSRRTRSVDLGSVSCPHFLAKV